jgi:hypothetical protein
VWFSRPAPTDLKIENILISQSGNIKLIDFGLSNLFDPVGHLGTFCGSLYFAAPELLNAKLYTGPEVDVWSFGVVLYVLVCGKVPFDDQSMPALHAKIKRGLVEYPVWLSAECKHLLSRMLVTNPAARATLPEALAHAWTLRGYTAPPDVHLVRRDPLRAEDVDRAVLAGMKGFEFGTEDQIERRLSAVLASDAYARAVAAWERHRATAPADALAHGALRFGSADALATPGGSKKAKRFSGFEWYRKKLFSPATSPPGTPFARSPPGSAAALAEPVDPTRGFHPLVSMYFLAREKLERERVHGAGVFASSQLSLDGAPHHDDGATPGAPPKTPRDKTDYAAQIAQLPVPQASREASRPRPSPARSRARPPRARTAGATPSATATGPRGAASPGSSAVVAAAAATRRRARRRPSARSTRSSGCPRPWRNLRRKQLRTSPRRRRRRRRPCRAWRSPSRSPCPCR